MVPTDTKKVIHHILRKVNDWVRKVLLRKMNGLSVGIIKFEICRLSIRDDRVDNDVSGVLPLSR